MTELTEQNSVISVAADTATSPVSASVTVTSDGYTRLKYVLPVSEYYAGCTATGMGMLLAYYDCYGYQGYDLSSLINSTDEIDVYSRYTGNDLHGSGDEQYYSVNDIYDMTNDGVLEQFIADGHYADSAEDRTGYYSRFVEKTPAEE